MTRLRTRNGDMNDMTSARIAGALRARGLTQKAFADICGVSEGTISKILRAKYPLRSVLSRRTHDAVVSLLATYTGIALEDLREMTTASRTAEQAA